MFNELFSKLVTKLPNQLNRLPQPIPTLAQDLTTQISLKPCNGKPSEDFVMYAINRTATTDMEVTSIRLERELKEKLKDLSGNQGYQALIRDILWNYVQQKSGDYQPLFSRSDIRASIEAIAQREERCTLTGAMIRPQEQMLLGLTSNGDMVPLSVGSLKN